MVFVVVLVAAMVGLQGPIRIVTGVVIVVAFVAVAVLTGDPPGGPHR